MIVRWNAAMLSLTSAEPSKRDRTLPMRKRMSSHYRGIIHATA